ncbi:hypothetical protein BAE44_0025036 [Dichanthelium oligosanthes]|uniref:Uncharacterized protein n=1 Tax=Dichanthelium oligosanthes TaxID=888268 RepID=A0A1E5UMD1_9POAL|nr:hypothetical protein BAE44_0025036 [Dichanthelium oligosanthes]
MQGNEAEACYKTKIVKNWNAIITIYPTDHANGEGAKTGAENGQEPLPLLHVTPPCEILAAFQVVPDLARCDLLQSYGKLILNERLFQALMELPMAMRKEWLLMLNEKNRS